MLLLFVLLEVQVEFRVVDGELSLVPFPLPDTFAAISLPWFWLEEDAAGEEDDVVLFHGKWLLFVLYAAALATAAAAYISNGWTMWPKPLRKGSMWFFSFFLHLARRFLNQTF